MARLANEFAKKEGLDAQKVLEHFLSSVAAEAAKPVQGRKNHYGSRSERGMLAAAVMYSLIETCSRLGIDTCAYFREALTRAIENPGTVYTPAMHLAAVNP